MQPSDHMRISKHACLATARLQNLTLMCTPDLAAASPLQAHFALLAKTVKELVAD